MNIWMGIIAISAILLGILLVWTYLFFKKKLAKVTNDINLFKKEKEYYAEVMMTFSADHSITFANQAAKDLFSLNDDYQIASNAEKVDLKLNQKSPEDFFTSIKTISRSKNESCKIDNAMLILKGKRKKVNLYIDTSVYDDQPMITCVIDMENNQINANKNEEGKTGYLDFLTSLPSQFAAISDINTLTRDSKNKSEFFSVLLLGIDHFNDIQTTLGLSYSNQILKTLAQFFVSKQDENITIYRMDADKFLLLIRNVSENTPINTIARDMIISVGNVYRDNNDVRLTSSIGIVEYPRDGENATKLIDNVYIALKKAQERSESNIKLFNANHDAIHIDESKMSTEIHTGLHNNEFLLHYQPIFDLEGERIIGAEALVRWNHPEHGLLAADKFLEVAEKTGLIVDLGEYVFSEAIQESKKCNIGNGTDFQITINLSLQEMQIDKLLPKLEKLFDKYNVDRSTINLDIRESAIIEYIDKTAHDFKLLNEFGLSLSIDNFGAGFSSFKYLSMFPLNMIKIDRSLIFDLTVNLEHQTAVRAIINFAHTLGYKVVAEGVETTKEATILKTLNCDYAQGYLYSRPLPAKEFEELLN